MEQITENQRLLLHLLGLTLFDAPGPLPKESDWKGVMEEAWQQTVLPLAYHGARDCFSGKDAQILEDRINEIVVNNMLMDFDHVELHDTMEKAGIPYVVMKGSASAAYYPQPMLRMMGDVDFLVRKEDAERAGEALKARGFRETEDRDSQIHHTFIRENDHESVWELHWRPNGIPNTPVGEKIWAMLADSIETARLHETDNGVYRVPDVFHHGLMILIHTAMHLIHSGVGLRHLCDWAVFAARVPKEEFRGLFEEKLRAVGLWDFASALTAVSVRYLGCPDPGWTEDHDPTMTEALLLDVLSGGNFGKKDKQRINQAKLFVNRTEGTVHRDVGLRNLASAMNVKARRTLPAAVNHPALLPVGWILAGAKHVGRIVKGERPPIHLGEMVGGALERSKLYRSLHIFGEE